MKALVLFYSRTGVTRRVAHVIAEILRCDIDEIKDTVARDGIRGFLSGGKDAVLRRKTVIRPLRVPLHNYDLIVAGGPVWAGVCPPALRTLLCEIPGTIRLAFFCTEELQGSDTMFREMEKLAARSPCARLPVRTRAVQSNACIDEVKQFARTLQDMTPRHTCDSRAD